MHKLRGIVAQEDGAILVFVALIMVVLLGMAALAIDIGQMYIAKQRAQNVCDAAALAGGPFLDGKPSGEAPAENTAILCKDRNNDQVASWQVEDFTADAAITTVQFDDGRTATCEPGEAMKVAGQVHVNFAFAGLFGLTGLDVPADATVKLGPARTVYSAYLVPWGNPPLTVEFGQSYDFGPVDTWQDSFMDAPGNWLTLSFGRDSGVSDYVDRLRMQYKNGNPIVPLPVSTGDDVQTLTGGAGGTAEQGQSKTYDGLIGKNGQPGRILLETDARFTASHFVNASGYDEYWWTGYNPDAWTTWQNSIDPITDLYPATNRIVILPIIDPGDVQGSTYVTILGFSAFFIERVWDGVTPDPDRIDPATGLNVIPERGDIKGYFIQAIVGGSGEGWIFAGSGSSSDKPPVRQVYLIS